MCRYLILFGRLGVLGSGVALVLYGRRFIMEEIVEHVLRSCPIAATVWNRSIRPSRLLEFMRLPFDTWFMTNRPMDFARCKDTRLGDMVDCHVGINVANRVWIKSRQGNTLVDDIRELSPDWEVIIRTIPWEMNKVADALARSSRDCPCGTSFVRCSSDFSLTPCPYG
ncbi:hypothetical protein V6N12_057385 [Hibiscus sabdariffa]|uniref:RNase H type-1 domain-containing protein n=1 Tax=Hibiscus sabdariffa TaxID=183260 RepID=A0ABR2DCL3_9ROSI